MRYLTFIFILFSQVIIGQEQQQKVAAIIEEQPTDFNFVFFSKVVVVFIIAIVAIISYAKYIKQERENV